MIGYHATMYESANIPFIDHKNHDVKKYADIPNKSFPYTCNQKAFYTYFLHIHIHIYIYIHISYIYIYIIEGSLEVKLPTIWTVEKQR